MIILFCPYMAQITGISGSTVVSFKYKNGIIIASDMGANYSSLSFTDVVKLYKLTDNCLVGFSGQISDIQYLHELVKDEINKNTRKLDPQGIYKLIQRIMYNRRNDLDLLFISVVVCGIKKKPNAVFGSATDSEGKMLGVINSKGNFWFSDSVATGIASHIILPVLREKNTENLTKEEAIEFMKKCMRILCYKDTRASHIAQIAVCERQGIIINDPCQINTNWEIGQNPEEIIIK